MTFQQALAKAGICPEHIERILGVDYPKDPGNPKQDAANFMAHALREAEALLGFERLAEVMAHRSCCKSGFRLDNAKRLAKEHGGRPFDEKLALLGQLQYMGKPTLNADGDIETVAIGRMDSCPCWALGGCKPANGPMPLTYCLCCAGHFLFHYQKALGVKLSVKKVVSSNLGSGGEPCVFVYQIIQ